MSCNKRLDLKVGYSCNNNCIFCAQAHKKCLGDKSTDIIKNNLKTSYPSCEEVVFTGGEPTIRSDFFELISYAKSLGYKKIQIQSNGRKFSDLDFCMRAINSGANSFSLAIHGHDAKSHDGLTGESGSFEQTKQGIKNLIELNQPISTNTVVVRQNYKNLPEIARLLKNIHPDQVQFAFVHPIGNALLNKEEVVPQMSSVIPYLRDAMETIRKGDIEPRAEAIPFCLLPGYESYLTENYIPDIKISDLDSEVDWTTTRKNLAKKKFSQCRICEFNLDCEGTWKEYPEIFGETEFEPCLPNLNEIVLELTNKCNLDCEFCFNPVKQENEMTKKDVFRIIDIVKGKTNAVRFTGGEPLLRTDLGEILKHAKDNKIYTILNTNGILFDETNMQLVKHVDDILISFHDLDNVERKFKNIKEIRKMNPGIFIQTCTILTNSNIENLENYYILMNSLNIDNWFLLRQIPNQKYPNGTTKEQAISAIKKVIELNDKYRMNVKISNSLPFCVYDKQKVASVCTGGKNDSGHTRLFIDSFGNINQDYFSKKPLGNIKEHNLLEIWLGEFLVGVRNLENLPIECVDCEFKISCKGGLQDDPLKLNPSSSDR